MAIAAPSPAIILTGTEQPNLASRTLKAGPLAAELENGALRTIRFGGVEVLRMVAFLVRDENWGTFDPAIGDLKVTEGADGFGVSACEPAPDTSGDSGDGKIVAENWNARLADIADDGFKIFNLLSLFWPVQQYVVPVCRVKIFNGFQFKAGGVDFLFDRGQLFVSPEFVGIAGQPPAGIIADGLVAGLIAP